MRRDVGKLQDHVIIMYIIACTVFVFNPVHWRWYTCGWLACNKWACSITNLCGSLWADILREWEEEEEGETRKRRGVLSYTGLKSGLLVCHRNVPCGDPLPLFSLCMCVCVRLSKWVSMCVMCTMCSGSFAVFPQLVSWYFCRYPHAYCMHTESMSAC